MVNIKLCVLFLFIGSAYFINECRAQKPEIAYLSRFLFRLGKSFIPKPTCKPAAAPPKAAMEEPDDEDEEKIGLELFEPSPPTVATEAPTTTKGPLTEKPDERAEPKQEETTEEVTEIADTEAPTE